MIQIEQHKNKVALEVKINYSLKLKE